MKRMITFIGSLLFLCAFFSLSVWAATFRDDMSRLDNSVAKTYQNLKLQDAVGTWSAFPDSTFSSFSNLHSPRGSATYRVQNARTVSATIYSSLGTDVVMNSEGEYILSTLSAGGGLRPTGLRPQLSPNNNRVYVRSGESMLYLTYDRAKGYIFKPCQDQPTDLIPYGVSFWISSDGNNYQPLSQQRTASQYISRALYTQETWSASIPTGGTYLRVEINDLSMVEDYAGGTPYVKAYTTMTMLAQIDMTGDQMIVGVPEPIKTESQLITPPESLAEESSKATKSTASSASGHKKTASPTGGGETSSQKEKTTTSKFEGTLPPASTASRAGGKTTDGSSLKPKAESKAKIGEEQKEEERQAVYYIEGEAPVKDNFATGVIVYIAVVSVVILFLLLRPKKGE